MTDGERYFFDDAETERSRLRLIADASEPATCARLERLGVDAGWRFVEVAAGAGSIAAWLAERVGPTGHVVAIDQDIRHLDWIQAANISVRAQDIVVETLERGQFDPVHVRALLEHVRDVDRGLQHMVDALVPGGWLLAEGADFGQYLAMDKSHPLAPVFDRAMSKTLSFVKAARLFDPFVFSSLPVRLESMGLREISVADESIILGSSPEAIMFERSWEHSTLHLGRRMCSPMTKSQRGKRLIRTGPFRSSRVRSPFGVAAHNCCCTATPH
jgi:SAM-dependent methyltransferase